MIQTYLLPDFCCQIVNFVWGQYFLNISRKRINVISKTEHDMSINWSGIGVYAFQGENVKVHGMALKCVYLVKKYIKSTDWYWSVCMGKN